MISYRIRIFNYPINVFIKNWLWKYLYFFDEGRTCLWKIGPSSALRALKLSSSTFCNISQNCEHSADQTFCAQHSQTVRERDKFEKWLTYFSGTYEPFCLFWYIFLHDSLIILKIGEEKAWKYRFTNRMWSLANSERLGKYQGKILRIWIHRTLQERL